ncbi:hypothetical protein H6G81_04760 [Scytonema hofmannii FACHB-248]|uniref:Uncharacterized protein n=1 Tax=Scytonema hofmannii FACHB-248 TaxID=1842502 RepID=A0ABR8GKW6_9CYAN|nr:MULTISPECIES: hypothetical protein [Nostocales]MBD2603861.1 hypothetical protein [Scytonema hofmannii FACHB-248]
MTNWEQQQKEFKIQKEILQVEDDLVIAIEKIIKDKNSCKNLEESQYRNLMHVADTTISIEVIKNFLRYQLGRDNKWGEGGNSLAQQIIDDIDKLLRNKAEEIVKKVQCDDKFKAVWLELTRRYLGYGSRRLKYLKANKNNSDSKTN